MNRFSTEAAVVLTDRETLGRRNRSTVSVTADNSSSAGNLNAIGVVVFGSQTANSTAGQTIIIGVSQ